MPALVNGGTFHSATGGTFHSDIPGTFESDTDGTFNVMQSCNERMAGAAQAAAFLRLKSGLSQDFYCKIWRMCNMGQ